MSDTPDAPLTPDAPPVPARRPRADGWTMEKQRTFLSLLAETGSVRHAAEAVGMSQSSAYRLRLREGPEFDEAWKRATRLSLRTLQESAMQRAIHGSEVPIYSRGEHVGMRTVHDERLVMFLLKTRGGRRIAAETFEADQRYDDRAATRFMLDQMQMELLTAHAPEIADTEGLWQRLDDANAHILRKAEIEEEIAAMRAAMDAEEAELAARYAARAPRRRRGRGGTPRSCDLSELEVTKG